MYPVPIPVSDELFHLKMKYTEKCYGGLIGIVTRVKKFSEFPNETIAEYFYKRTPKKYVLVAKPDDSDNDVIFMCSHCLLIDENCWIQATTDRIDINRFEEMELWEWKEYYWIRFDSEKTRLVS